MKTQPSSGPRDVRRWIGRTTALEHDIIRVLSRATVVGRFWVDLEAARRFKETAAASEGATITYTHLFIKAAALAALQAPALHRMYGVFRSLDPATSDVGVSVEGRSILSPVVVIAAADRKSLCAIANELRAQATQAQSSEARRMAWLSLLVYLLPIPALRRVLLRALFASICWRRRMVGTIQISNVGFAGLEDAQIPMVGELLLVISAITKRVTVDEHDHPAVRMGAWFMIHASHQKLNGATCAQFTAAFRALLAEPERLR